MHRRYYFLTALLLILTFGLLLLPENSNLQDRQPWELAQGVNSDSRFLSTDQVASRIIRDDPSLLLVDVRDSAQYNKFSLEGAVNIPLPELLSSDNEAWLGSKGMDVVFYSNGDIDAEKAWIIAYRKGYDRLYIMRGGLNLWAETILKPQKPLDSEPRESWDLYQFRLAAGLHFRGGEVIIEDVKADQTKAPSPKKAVKIAPPAQHSMESEGGC